jgi:hypothetical protein
LPLSLSLPGNADFVLKTTPPIVGPANTPICTPGIVLKAGASCVFNVVFTPTIVGPEPTRALTVSDSVFSLTGTVDGTGIFNGEYVVTIPTVLGVTAAAGGSITFRWGLANYGTVDVTTFRPSLTTTNKALSFSDFTTCSLLSPLNSPTMSQCPTSLFLIFAPPATTPSGQQFTGQLNVLDANAADLLANSNKMPPGGAAVANQVTGTVQ